MQLTVISGERAQCFPATAHQAVVDHRLVRSSQRPELGRQGKGQQKVGGRDLPAQLPFQPLLALMVLTVLTMRAVAMAAGVRYQHGLRATLALHLHLRAGLTNRTLMEPPYRGLMEPAEVGGFSGFGRGDF